MYINKQLDIQIPFRLWCVTVVGKINRAWLDHGGILVSFCNYSQLLNPVPAKDFLEILWTVAIHLKSINERFNH